LYLSHNRFEADFYFKPDRRKKFGRGMASKFRLNPKRYYLRSWQSPLANTSHLQTLEEKSAALGEALREAKAAVEKLGCYMDISLETQILRHLDVPKLLGWT